MKQSESPTNYTLAQLGPVHLAVTDAKRATEFWTAIVGLTQQPSHKKAIHLGVGATTLIVLHPEAASPVVRHRTGLYHVAIHLPSRTELARAMARLYAMRYPHSPTDHLVTEATYLWDQDGNGIELTFETPHRGQFAILEGQPAAVDPQGKVFPPTFHLDVESVLAELNPQADIFAPLADGTHNGHIHLHVRDLAEARHFYGQLLGFEESMYVPEVGMLDYRIPNQVPHLLAMNEWSGKHAAPPPPDSSGLREFALEISDEATLQAILRRLTHAGISIQPQTNGHLFADPSANLIRLRTITHVDKVDF
jgi:catechol 2,3-dioxygenase